ncbi:tetratricopeptide repeat protein [Microbacterium sp. HJ5]
MSDDSDWTARIDAFWTTFDETDCPRMLADMRALVDERPAGDAAALAEWGGVHDALGLEEEAVNPYRDALAAGLDPVDEHQVTLQLASTLRNLGDHDESIRLLEELDAPELGDAPAAFLALALHSAGRADEALQTALAALAPHLPRYNRALAAYAADLTRRS